MDFFLVCIRIGIQFDSLTICPLTLSAFERYSILRVIFYSRCSKQETTWANLQVFINSEESNATGDFLRWLINARDNCDIDKLVSYGD